MKYSELMKILDNINWFTFVGNYKSEGNKIAIHSLEAWDSAIFPSDMDDKLTRCASLMNWLPTSWEEVDPIYGHALLDSAHIVPDNKKLVMAAYKKAMKSLREFNKTQFKSGRNDFSLAAKGAALYCVKMTAIESLAGKPGLWTEIFKLYIDGYWPCGLMPNGELVVY